MSKRDDRLILEDMLEAVIKIIEFTATHNFDSFVSDTKTVDAVLRNLTVLGECARNISTEFKHNNKQIEWDKIARSRHIIVHEYFSVDHDIVWKIITTYLTPLKQELEKL